MVGLKIEDLSRDERGVWTAVVVNGDLRVPVIRECGVVVRPGAALGSWAMVCGPEGKGRREVRREIAYELAAMVRPTETRERREREKAAKVADAA